MKVEIIKEREKGFLSYQSYDLWQKVGCYETVSYCSRHDIQKSCYLKQCSISSNFSEHNLKFSLKHKFSLSLKHNFFVNKSSMYSEIKTQKFWSLSYHSK